MIRKQPNPQVLRRLADLERGRSAVSVITLGEMRRGTSGMAAGRRRDQVERWIYAMERERLGLVLPITLEVAMLWGSLTASCSRLGRPLAAADGLIAATALAHDLTLVTRNTRDFEATGVRLLNPWLDSAD